MSDYEAEARYEHATTILDWNAASDEPPKVVPPSDDDGWMLFSQNPAKAVELHENGVPVTRFLCVWRRRLTRVETKKPTRAESVAAWKAKRDEEKRRRDQELTEQHMAWQRERERRRAEEKAAMEKEICDAWVTSSRLWELIKGMSGIRALAFEAGSRSSAWKVFFAPNITEPERVDTMRQINQITRGIRKDVLVARVDTKNVRGLTFMASNDATLPLSERTNSPGYAESFEISAVASQSFSAAAGESFVFRGTIGTDPAKGRPGTNGVDPSVLEGL